MTNDTLSISSVSNYLESTDPFPIDFDQAWQWLGYSKKDKAKDRLISEFIDGIDFRVFPIKGENPQGGRPVEKIMLSVDCLKCLGMMAGTAKGKEVRRYFLECERALRHQPWGNSLPPTLQLNRGIDLQNAHENVVEALDLLLTWLLSAKYEENHRSVNMIQHILIPLSKSQELLYEQFIRKNNS
jgi:phage anti-repressor protein